MMRLLMSFSLVSLWGVAFSSVWIVQWSTRDKYEVGDSAELQCNISSHQETLKGCRMSWIVLNQSNKERTKDILTVEKYQHRVKLNFSSTFSSMTLNNLSSNDTEPLFCTASCFIDGTLQKITGSGISLTILERQPELLIPWLKYLLFSANLFIFLIATFTCALVIRKRIQSNKARNL